MSRPIRAASDVADLYDGIVAAVSALGETERAAQLRALAERLNGHADTLVDDPCQIAGLPVMREVFDILSDREKVPPSHLEDVTARDVAALYDEFIGPAVDDVEDALTTDGR